MAASTNVQLTGETVSPSTGRAVALTLAVALLVVFVANFGARALLRAVPANRTYWLVERKWELLESLPKAPAWVMLGDSSGNQGFRPDVWREAMEGDAVNLCTVGDLLPVGDAWMLERLVERLGPPSSGVVIVHVHDVWGRGTGALVGPLGARVPLPWGYWERVRPPLSPSRSELATLWLSRYLPLYAENTTLTRLALSPLRRAPPPLRLDDAGYMRWDEPNPKSVRSDVAGHLRSLGQSEFAPSRFDEAAVRRVAELAEQHRFHVYYAPSPVADELAQSRAFQARLVQLRAWLGTLAGSSPWVHVLAEPPPSFPAEQMENADHLTHEAAGRYTLLLAEAVKRAVASASPAPSTP
jgi:hypothetical protein